MLTYFFSYFAVFLPAYFEILINPKKRIGAKTIVLFLLALLFAILAGVRYGVGVDYFTYFQIFVRTAEFSVEYFFTVQWLEPGFRLLVYLLNKAGSSPYFMFFFFSLMSLTFLVKGIKKSSNLVFFSFFIFFCLFYTPYVFNVLRQGIVMSLFIYLLNDISERNFKKVIFFSLIGMSIHYSGVFIVLSYFLYDFRVSKKTTILLVFSGVLMFIINGYVSGFLIPLIPGYVGDKLLSYYSSRGESVDIISFIQRLLIFIPFFGFYERLKSLKPEFLGFFNMYLVGFLLYTLFSFESLFATRINMFFRILEVILVPYIVETHKNRVNRLVLFLLLGLWLTLVFLSQLRNPANYPFRTIFEFI